MRNTHRRSAFWITAAAGLLFGSCVTVNIYFPAAAVEKAADRIIQETWGSGDQEQQEGTPQENGPQGRRHFNVPRGGLGLALGPPAAAAQEVDINITTPAIRALKDAMRQRSVSLKPHLDRGAVGISSDGLLVVRDPGSLSLQEKAAVTRSVDAENRDREALYREIAAANNFGVDRVADIKRIFAASWIRNAEPGWFVQDANGGWARKP